MTHFSPREQAALREAGLSTADIGEVADQVAAAAESAADEVETFFETHETVHSDMDRAHASGDVHEHDVDFCDLFTHSEDVRGYLRFDTWGVWVADARVLREGVVELTLGPTIHDRVRFAADPGEP